MLCKLEIHKWEIASVIYPDGSVVQAYKRCIRCNKVKKRFGKEWIEDTLENYENYLKTNSQILKIEKP